MGTIAITGSASGIGKATRERLEAEGHRVIGVDLRSAEVIADLTTAEGRAAMVDGVTRASGGTLDGLLAGAGISGRYNESGIVMRLNYFGAVATLNGLRPLLAASGNASAVAISSNAATTQPGGADPEAVAWCLAGQEEEVVANMSDYPRPTKAPGKPEEIAGLIRYLLSDEARYVVGSFIVIDGGTEAVLRADDWPTSITDT